MLGLLKAIFTPRKEKAKDSQPSKPALKDGYLSEHFTLAEATHSATAIKHGVPNTPDGTQYANMVVAANGMEQVRSLLGNNPCNVSSWLRVRRVNQLVGGSATSDHMTGFSIDFTCAQFGSAYDVCMAIAKSGIKFDQLIYEENSRGSKWVHISFAPRQRMQLLTKKPKGGYLQGIVK